MDERMPTSTAGEDMFVDSHVHVFSKTMPFDEKAWNRPDYEFRTDELLSTLDRHDVPFAVISAASLFGDLNEYTIAATTMSKRLRGTVIASPDCPHAQLRSMRDSGIVGVRLQWTTVGAIPDITTSQYRRFFYRLNDLGMHIEVAAHGEDLAVTLSELERSRVTRVINHFGLPDPKLGQDSPSFRATLQAAETPDAFVKLSAGFRLGDTAYTAALAQRLLAAYGPDRLFWGSDCPFVGKEGLRTYSQVLEEFRAWVPALRDRLRIAKAALRFYFG